MSPTNLLQPSYKRMWMHFQLLQVRVEMSPLHKHINIIGMPCGEVQPGPLLCMISTSNDWNKYLKWYIIILNLNLLFSSTSSAKCWACSGISLSTIHLWTHFFIFLFHHFSCMLLEVLCTNFSPALSFHHPTLIESDSSNSFPSFQLLNHFLALIVTKLTLKFFHCCRGLLHIGI